MVTYVCVDELRSPIERRAQRDTCFRMERRLVCFASDVNQYRRPLEAASSGSRDCRLVCEAQHGMVMQGVEARRWGRKEGNRRGRNGRGLRV